MDKDPKFFNIPTIIMIILLFICLFFGAKSCRAEMVDLRIIAQIESSGNPEAYNKGSKATGLYQITPICLADYNQYHPNRQFQLNEMFYPAKAQKVASWYLETRIPALLKHFGIADTLENRLWCYNGGIGLCKRGIMPKETRDYVKKYKALSFNY